MEYNKPRIPVSKATIGVIEGEVGARLIKDIQSTTINKSIIEDCKKAMESLSKGKNK